MATIPEALKTAIQLQQQGHLSQAEQIYRQVLQQQPHHAQALHLLGLLGLQVGKYEIAIEYISKAIEANPSNSAFHNNLGVVFKKVGTVEEAIVCYQKALELNPKDASCHYNLGNLFRQREQLEEATVCYQEAVAIQPEYFEAHNNLGLALRDRGQLVGAITCFQKALAINSNYAEAHLNWALMLLLFGDFRRGFAEHEWRWQMNDIQPRPFTQPLWDGSNLEGRTILLHAEQGLGDTIQFIRYAPIVAGYGGRVLVECYAPLIQLFKSIPGIEQLLVIGETLPEFDVHAPLMSLPYILGTTLETVPAHIPYLSPPIPLIELEVFPQVQLKVGIVWSTKPTHPTAGRRSYPPSYLLKLQNIPGIALYSLQKDPPLADIEQLRKTPKVQDLSDQLHDFTDTASVISQLDLVITVDTAIAHLAGALGKKVWVLLPFIPDWRWMLGHQDSIWYPTMRLFRQESPGDWAGVFRRVAEALDNYLDLTVC
ncbi:MAG: tetratricopeptide repeat-containing glycosyltransferase family protein [Aphanothece sp. CMT-3BRIN-NPC111]|jgi:Flp pilus assembly protein TadD|nr:tetratricopeptide repeat-containing glycosyltransferase family protein [Aphanothece sp. CMT-3BRIN-NPC111]